VSAATCARSGSPPARKSVEFIGDGPVHTTCRILYTHGHLFEDLGGCLMGRNAERGDEFEREVETLLNLQPGTTVQRQVSINGKLVDFLCKEMSGFGITRTVVVEAKNYSRALRREEAAQMLYDYKPLIDKGFADIFLLVTSNGIVPNAKLLFDGKMIHQTKDELFRNVFPCQSLLTNMQLAFGSGGIMGAPFVRWRAGRDFLGVS
jgi:hypothetical protein